MTITGKLNRKLLTMLDSVDLDLWQSRLGRLRLNDSTSSAVAVRTVAMLLQQMAYANVLNDEDSVQQARLTVIEATYKHLPLQYQFAEAAVLANGCMGPEQVASAEVDFATETVLAALAEHHGFDGAALGRSLGKYFVSKTLPLLKAAVKEVLDMRNAANF